MLERKIQNRRLGRVQNQTDPGSAEELDLSERLHIRTGQEQSQRLKDQVWKRSVSWVLLEHLYDPVLCENPNRTRI